MARSSPSSPLLVPNLSDLRITGRGFPRPVFFGAEHAPQLGGGSPLPNLMEVKGGAARKGVVVRRGLKEAWSKAVT